MTNEIKETAHELTDQEKSINEMRALVDQTKIDISTVAEGRPYEVVVAALQELQFESIASNPNLRMRIIGAQYMVASAHDVLNSFLNDTLQVSAEQEQQPSPTV